MFSVAQSSKALDLRYGKNYGVLHENIPKNWHIADRSSLLFRRILSVCYAISPYQMKPNNGSHPLSYVKGETHKQATDAAREVKQAISPGNVDSIGWKIKKCITNRCT